MRLLLLTTLAILCGSLGVASYAASVRVTTTVLQTKYGILTNMYYETVSGPGSSTPSVNTAQSPPAGTGSYQIAKGSSDYLWSPQFSSTTSMGAGGTWVVDLWAAAASSGTMTISIYTTDAAGNIQSTIVNGAQTNSIGKSSGQVATTFSGAAAGTVPVNGYILVVLTAPSSGPRTFTIYWGAGQLTDFQAPIVILR